MHTHTHMHHTSENKTRNCSRSESDREKFRKNTALQRRGRTKKMIKGGQIGTQYESDDWEKSELRTKKGAKKVDKLAHNIRVMIEHNMRAMIENKKEKRTQCGDCEHIWGLWPRIDANVRNVEQIRDDGCNQDCIRPVLNLVWHFWFCGFVVRAHRWMWQECQRDRSAEWFDWEKQTWQILKLQIQYSWRIKTRNTRNKTALTRACSIR